MSFDMVHSFDKHGLRDDELHSLSRQSGKCCAKRTAFGHLIHESSKHRVRVERHVTASEGYLLPTSS
jgi:hypothetical protein